MFAIVVNSDQVLCQCINATALKVGQTEHPFPSHASIWCRFLEDDAGRKQFEGGYDVFQEGILHILAISYVIAMEARENPQKEAKGQEPQHLAASRC